MKSDKFVLHKVIISGEFDSKKEPKATEFEQRPQAIVTPLFRYCVIQSNQVMQV